MEILKVKRMFDIIDSSELLIIDEVAKILAQDNNFCYQVGYKKNGIIEMMNRFIYSRAELYFLWEAFSNSMSAQFLIFNSELVEQFKDWLKEVN